MNGQDFHLNDPKKILILLMILAIGFLVYVGDRVCFSQNEVPKLERWIAYPTVLGYALFEDRFFSNLFSFVIYSGVVGGGFGILFSWIERTWIEPMMMRKTIQQMEREKKWINRYGKDLL